MNWRGCRLPAAALVLGLLAGVHPACAARKPRVLKLIVNDGQPTSYGHLMKLRSKVSRGAADHQISEDPSFYQTDWKHWRRKISFEFSPGAGKRTLYFRVRDKQQCPGQERPRLRF